LTRVAIPIFRMRVSPVLDSCTRLLLVDIERGHEVDRKELYLDAMTLTERVTLLQKSSVDVVICGGISEVLENLLSSTHVDLISGISGEIERVLEAYVANTLDDGKFCMPGVHRDSR